MQTASRYPWGKGTPMWVAEVTQNDSDKTFTVPARKIWVVLGIYATLTSTVDAGNRSMAVRVASGVPTTYMTFYASHVQAASLTYNYLWVPAGFNNATVTASGMSNQSMPELVLPAGYTLRVWDSAAIQPAADDMSVFIHYIEYDA